jgi:alpha-L-fucosidase
VLPGLNQKVKYDQFLSDNSEMKYIGREKSGTQGACAYTACKKSLVAIM